MCAESSTLGNAPRGARCAADSRSSGLTQSEFDPVLHEVRVQATPFLTAQSHATNAQGEDPIRSAHYAVPDRTYRDWCTLFSAPCHEGMSFGDGGSLAVVILHEDLAEARYDRLWTDTSTG